MCNAWVAYACGIVSDVMPAFAKVVGALPHHCWMILAVGILE